MSRWGNRSSKFQRNMRALEANEEFTAEPEFESPATFNQYAETVDAVTMLKQLLEGVESGQFRLENLSMTTEVDDFTVRTYNGAMPVTLPDSASIVIEMRLKANPNVTLPDDYPELGEAPRSQVGAAPPRQLILDDGNEE
jgi:hypothetical protein